MFDVKSEGFNQLQKNLRDLEKKAKQLNGSNSVPLDKLFSDAFMASHSEYASFQKLVDSASLEIDSNEDLKTEEWNKFVEENTLFNSWEDMYSTAVTEWAAKQLGR